MNDVECLILDLLVWPLSSFRYSGCWLCFSLHSLAMFDAECSNSPFLSW